MTFELSKELVFIDVETTGLHVLRDRILQIAMVKFKPGSDTPEEKMFLIHPGIPISEESIKIHGITPEDLIHQPKFEELAEEIFSFIGDADLAGYNSNRFDVPILMEEFARCGIEFDVENRRLIDVQRIFYKMEPRTLRAAYQFYCGKEIQQAHDAMADVKATIEVLQGQLEKYRDIDLEEEGGEIISKPVQNNVQALHEFTNDQKILDATQRLRYNEAGEIVFNFGKHIGKPVAKILYEDRNYYHWILEKEFSVQVKNLVRKILSDYLAELQSKK
ncbi:MAG: 3'-5' exonuclease [Saprospiraceae bacterium]|nr:3'-5' exonuclease [Saprospiraceae bacterium]